MFIHSEGIFWNETEEQILFYATYYPSPLPQNTHTPDLLHLLLLQHITQRLTVSMDRFDFSVSCLNARYCSSSCLQTHVAIFTSKHFAYIGYTRFYISHKQGFLHIFDKMSTKCIWKHLSSFVGFWHDKLAVNRCLVRVETIFNFIWRKKEKESVQCLTFVNVSFIQSTLKTSHFRWFLTNSLPFMKVTQWKCVICNLPIC